MKRILLAGVCLVIGYWLLVIGLGGCGQQKSETAGSTLKVTNVSPYSLAK